MARALSAAGVTPEAFRAALDHELVEMRRKATIYREGGAEPQLTGKTIVVVDDGLATGSTMYCALQALRQRRPAQLIVAVPVAPRDSVHRLELIADHVVCPYQPFYFGSIGAYYENFTQVSDGEVRHLLADSARESTRWKVA